VIEHSWPGLAPASRCEDDGPGRHPWRSGFSFDHVRAKPRIHKRTRPGPGPGLDVVVRTTGSIAALGDRAFQPISCWSSA
jgi:hypothetical protein